MGPGWLKRQNIEIIRGGCGTFQTHQLFGDGGDDRLYADYETGNHTLHGGSGNDLLVTRDGLVDQVFGDGGSDSAFADGGSDVLTSVETVL